VRFFCRASLSSSGPVAPVRVPSDAFPTSPCTRFMNPSIPFLLLLAFVAAGTCLPASEPRTLTRDAAIRTAFANHPDLKVAAVAIDRATSRLRWSGRLENPEFELNVSDDGIGRNEGERNYEVAFAQRFPLTSRLRHEKGLRRHQILLAEAEIAERRRELAGEIDRAFVELLATRERERLVREGLALNAEILRFLEEKAAGGEVSKLDAMQAKLATRTLGQERDRLAAQEQQQRLALLRHLGLDATSNLRLDVALDLPAATPSGKADLDTILSRRPDHVLALAKINEARAALVLEEAKRWEDVSVRLFVEGERAVDAPNGLERNTFGGIGISIPLPLRNRNQGGIEQAKLDGEEASRGVEAARFKIRGECEEAYRARLDAWKLAREAADELPALAKEQLDEVRKAHAQGEATFLQVRQAQEQLLEVRRAALDFLADYHLAEARVRLATGAYPGLESSSQNQK